VRVEAVIVRPVGTRGRGVIALMPFSPGDLIDSAPVVVLGPVDRQAVEPTILSDYWFYWEDGADDAWTAALALGPVSLCNHSDDPNARFETDPRAGRVDLIALRHIAPGDEITYDYGCELWFDVTS